MQVSQDDLQMEVNNLESEINIETDNMITLLNREAREAQNYDDLVAIGNNKLADYKNTITHLISTQTDEVKVYINAYVYSIEHIVMAEIEKLKVKYLTESHDVVLLLVLEKKCTSQENTINTLTAENQRLIEENKALTEECKRVTKKCKKTLETVKKKAAVAFRSLNDKYSEEIEKNEDATDIIANLEYKYAQLKKENDNLRKLLEECKNKIDSMEADRDSIMKQMEEQMNVIKKQEEESNDLKEKLRQYGIR